MTFSSDTNSGNGAVESVPKTVKGSKTRRYRKITVKDIIPNIYHLEAYLYFAVDNNPEVAASKLFKRIIRICGLDKELNKINNYIDRLNNQRSNKRNNIASIGIQRLRYKYADLNSILIPNGKTRHTIIAWMVWEKVIAGESVTRPELRREFHQKTDDIARTANSSKFKDHELTKEERKRDQQKTRYAVDRVINALVANGILNNDYYIKPASFVDPPLEYVSNNMQNCRMFYPSWIEKGSKKWKNSTMRIFSIYREMWEKQGRPVPVKRDIDEDSVVVDDENESNKIRVIGFRNYHAKNIKEKIVRDYNAVTGLGNLQRKEKAVKKLIDKTQLACEKLKNKNISENERTVLVGKNMQIIKEQNQELDEARRFVSDRMCVIDANTEMFEERIRNGEDVSTIVKNIPAFMDLLKRQIKELKLKNGIDDPLDILNSFDTGDIPSDGRGGDGWLLPNPTE